MPRTLSQKTTELLTDLAPFLASDLLVQGVVSAYANEIDRIESTAEALAGIMFPAEAQDLPILGSRYVVAILSMWETLLDLPVAPADVALADRRSKVLAHIRKRNSGAGSDWVSILTTAVGSIVWTYREGPGDYQVTLTIPFGGTYSAAQVGRLARVITPAHLQILVGYTTGFVIGVSHIGDPL